jgi:hypothetical protein
MLAALRNPSTQSGILSVAVCSDGMSLVVASRNHRATIWDRGTQKVRLVLTGHAAQINAVSFIGDGNRVVTASADGTVKLWSAEPVGQQGSSIVEPAGRSRLRTATFDAAGGLIATASQDARCGSGTPTAPGTLSSARSPEWGGRRSVKRAWRSVTTARGWLRPRTPVRRVTSPAAPRSGTSARGVGLDSGGPQSGG